MGQRSISGSSVAAREAAPSRRPVAPSRRFACSARLVSVAALVGLTSASSACSAPEAKAPHATRPLDERRAMEVIRRAVRAAGAEPAPAREDKLQGGWDIHVDVGVAGHAFGIVYVTEADARRFGPAIPPPNKKDERLRLVRGGDDGETRLVLLYEENYQYDDLAGESHEQTAITCERQLTRDVEDFVTHASGEHYK